MPLRCHHCGRFTTAGTSRSYSCFQYTDRNASGLRQWQERICRICDAKQEAFFTEGEDD